MRLLFLFIFINLPFSLKAQTQSPDNILGTWITEAKDLKVEVYKVNGKFFGKIIWFLCEANDPNMEDHFDTQNPNPKLRQRPWLGLVSVENLVFEKKGHWNGGKIYDPNSGNTFSSSAKMVSPNKLVVRGYWGIEVLGKNLIFYRV